MLFARLIPGSVRRPVFAVDFLRLDRRCPSPEVRFCAFCSTPFIRRPRSDEPRRQSSFAARAGFDAVAITATSFAPAGAPFVEHLYQKMRSRQF